MHKGCLSSYFKVQMRLQSEESMGVADRWEDGEGHQKWREENLCEGTIVKGLRMPWDGAVGEWWPPNNMSISSHLEPVNVISFGKGVFADAIKDLEMTSSWIIMTNILVRERQREIGDRREGKDPQRRGKDGGGDGRDATTAEPWKLEEAGTDSLLEPSKKARTFQP